MINIAVCGSGVCHERKAIIKDCAQFYLRTLLPKKRKINIKIDVVNNLETNEGVFGECYDNTQDEYYKYVIRLDDNESIETILVTLAHEFIHLKQYDRKELRFYSKKDDCARWKGQLYENFDYETAPWEVEATHREMELYKMYTAINS